MSSIQYSLAVLKCCSTSCLSMLNEHKSFNVISSSYISFSCRVQSHALVWCKEEGSIGSCHATDKAVCLLNSVTALLIALLSSFCFYIFLNTKLNRLNANISCLLVTETSLFLVHADIHFLPGLQFYLEDFIPRTFCSVFAFFLKPICFPIVGPITLAKK